MVDRKFGHGSSIFNEIVDEFEGVSIVITNPVREKAILKQVERQLNAIGNNGTKLRWEISTELGADGIKSLFSDPRIYKDIPGLKDVEVIFINQITVIY